jgi:hypothetical protein
MNHFRFYLILLSLAIILSYSVYLMFSPETIASLGDEDHFFEWLSALSLLLGSILLFEVFRFSKNFYFLILAFVFFFGFGEEISWGQRLLHFKTPERIEKINIQKEFSIHNLELFNRSNLKGEEKHGWQRLLEFNFLFRISTILFGIIFPILVFHSKFVHWFAQKMRLPVPPLSIGLFFAFNWITFKIIHSYLLHPGHSPKYYSGLSEIFECMGIVIMLTVIFYFYTERRTIVTGNDFKQTR